ncbi:transaldolase [Sphingomonas vulcanisoli]|uniref:Transaldolase n=1 Tax=Sphingomonas vulcanisoli TaxID=1658060 RepID=A0ABX0TUF8_9SPHN|nr:transaldolase [Sphingomonas vulcanisoli]NIJ08105.1 transaldolase [Sphingomonas vulcanisoli]
MSNLKELAAAGQAVWLDFVDRKFLAEGGLRKLVAEDGLTGVTSNPSIFEKAMGHGDAYDEGFKGVLGKGDATAKFLYESQAVQDIKDAAADLRPVYDELDGKDGYVSLEVSPGNAMETAATIEEAHKLWKAVDAPNVMIKVPGTKPGAPAIRQLIEDGLNINVTLLFALDAYQTVAMAYIEGLEARAAKGEPIDRIASVASFFVSRIDSVIDKKIDERLGAGDKDADALKAVRGKVAIANAKVAYAWYQDLIAGDRWQALAAKGAKPQRLLWASTGTKDPSFPDTLYIDTLIGPDTVNTMPPKTMDAFRDHGTVAQTLTQDVEAAKTVLAEAERLGLDLQGVTTELVVDGVKLFADAFDTLIKAVGEKKTALTSELVKG